MICSSMIALHTFLKQTFIRENAFMLSAFCNKRFGFRIVISAFMRKEHSVRIVGAKHFVYKRMR